MLAFWQSILNPAIDGYHNYAILTLIVSNALQIYRIKQLEKKVQKLVDVIFKPCVK